MSWLNNLRNVTHKAAVDLSAEKFKIIELDASGFANLAAAGEGFGVLQNIPQAGEAGTIAVDGETKFIAGGAVTVGALIRVGSGGWGIAANSGDTHIANFWTMGRAQLTTASGGIGTLAIMRQRFINVVSGSAI